MRPNSNPLLQELARSQHAPAAFDSHLDADLLAAFAEANLLPSERLGVLSHLAICPECREVLQVAIAGHPDSGQETSTERVPGPTRPPFWGWLPWAAAATAIIGATTILLLHPQKPQPPTATSTTTIQPVQDQQTQMPAASTEPPASTIPSAKTAHGKQARVHGEAPAAATAHRAPDLAKLRSTTQLQTAMKLSDPSADKTQVLAAIPPPIDDKTLAYASSQNITEQPSPAQNAMLPQTMNSAPALGGPMATAPVARQSSALATRPHWRINEDGKVERSFGNGGWQQVLDAGASKLRVVSVIGGSVWAAGDKLRLYRSVDNGMTWSAIPLSPKSGTGSAITHVRFQTPLHGRIDAADGSSWVTTDGGVTWK
jgi:hypothetical protein